MLELSDLRPLVEQEQDRVVSRRQFLKWGGAVQLGILTGAAGVAAGLVVAPNSAFARTGHRKLNPHHPHETRHHESHSHYHNEYYHENHHHDHALHDSRSHGYHDNRHLARHSQERALHLHNIHTGESVHTVYWAQGRYLPGGLKALNYLMRDHYSGDVARIDRRLFELLYVLRARMGYGKPFHVLSGYRCPATNAMLREQSDAVASHSLHMEGMAVDIRTPGLHTTYLRKAAMSLQQGGVGYYPDSDFVHVDTGPIRYW